MRSKTGMRDELDLRRSGAKVSYNLFVCGSAVDRGERGSARHGQRRARALLPQSARLKHFSTIRCSFDAFRTKENREKKISISCGELRLGLGRDLSTGLWSAALPPPPSRLCCFSVASIGSAAPKATRWALRAHWPRLGEGGGAGGARGARLAGRGRRAH